MLIHDRNRNLTAIGNRQTKTKTLEKLKEFIGKQKKLSKGLQKIIIELLKNEE
jgi:hypothetical protein